MSKTWLTWSTSLLLQGLVLMLVLGPCQCQFLSADAWSKSNVLDVFATVPQLANEASGAHTIQQTHNNNVTLTDEETDDETEEDLDLDLDPLAPHAAAAAAATDAASMMPLSQRKLSRGKRFVAFPLGSSASVAVCLTTGVLGNPDYLYLSFGLNWGVAYDLPNITWVLNNAHGWNTKKPMAAVAKIKRRHRRDVYGNLETMIDSNDLWPPPTLMTMMERAKTTTSPPPPPPQSTDKAKSVRSLSRSKRYLSFPEGSSFTVSVCFTVGIIGNPYYAHNSFGLNWGVAYDLPNNSWILQSLHGFSQRPVAAVILRRRTRNAIYQDIETIVDNMGYNGRDCVLRTLCESRQYFQRTKLNMVGEMLRAIFSLPKQRIFKRELEENADIVHYDNAYRHAHDFDCEKQYDCQFSLLELAFGKYSTPPKNYYAQ
ncbi:uncharacterized protein LOC117573306 [Drosophila albomicans]|uniref:Uncharacterized protein LOC117573306 n=1 Tax=Drosophila albomicans TaxID=7291 RepID=A0A6P8Z6W4_DROAB|nr:uncharacterized protein LOC117573306 [Drosophila albomicans]